LVEIKAHEKFNRRHMVDIPRIKFFSQRRYRANWPFVDGHELTPVLTRDIVFMVRHQVPIVGSQTIDEILTKEAKLTTAFKNLDNPAVIHYEGTIEGVEVEIEFLQKV
jgi:hypothetical protein